MADKQLRDATVRRRTTRRQSPPGLGEYTCTPILGRFCTRGPTREFAGKTRFPRTDLFVEKNKWIELKALWILNLLFFNKDVIYLL